MEKKSRVATRVATEWKTRAKEERENRETIKKEQQEILNKMRVEELVTQGHEYGDIHKSDISISIKITTSSNKELEVTFVNGSCNDSTLSSGLHDAYRIVHLIKLAYDAGRDGEYIEIIQKTEDY